MKIKANIIINYLCLALVIFGLFVSCNETNLNEISEIPQESGRAEYISPHKISKYFGNQRSHNWVKTNVPRDIGMVILDSKFKEIDYYFFRKFNSWFQNFVFQNGIMSLGEDKQNLDCDNHALLYKSTMAISSYKSGSSEELAIAVVVVRQVKEFAGIPATGNFHMLNLAFTNKGWYIFEPQTNEFVKLEDYPNQEYIQYIIL
jgi:hypothetical protein